MRSLRLSALILLAALPSTMLACSSPTEEDGVGASEGAQTAVERDTSDVIGLPAYFTVPKHALTEMTAGERAHPYPTRWSASAQSEELGLRIIGIQNGAGAKPTAGKNLGKAGVLKTGDIVLSFRPNLAETIPYAHMQMGVTHAGLIKLDGTTAKSVDQPLDSEHNSAAPFSSNHYNQTDALHIIRPRFMSEPGRAEKLTVWIDKAEAMIGNYDVKPPFNSDYLTPTTAGGEYKDSPAKLSTAIGKGLLANQLSSFKFFCSEMAYHLLSLSNCTPEQIEAAGEVAECVEAPFAMQTMVGGDAPGGLGEGPLLGIQAAARGGADPMALVGLTFGAPNPESAALSSGHRNANALLTQGGAVAGMQNVYALRLQSPGATFDQLVAGVTAQNAEQGGQLAQLNTSVPANYGPTSFLIESMKDPAARTTDYVATIVWASSANYTKIKNLRGAIPATAEAR